MLKKHYDVIIIGTGAGGGTLVRKLAESGKQILLVERGEFLKREKENWDPEEVFHKERYHSEDCLLYTSPSPRDRTRSRMPSSA